GAVMVAGLCFALGGVRLARSAARSLLAPIALVGAALTLGILLHARLPDPVPDNVKTMAPRSGRPTPPLFSRWSPVFRIDVLATPVATTHFLVHDGTLGSFLEQYDGNVASLEAFENSDRSFPFRVLGPAPNVAIIGSAGGHEILVSLHFRAKHITA